MAGLTSLSAVKWGQTVAESQASVRQGTGPVPPTHGQAAPSGQRVPGDPEAAASEHGRRRAHLAKECALQAGSGQASILSVPLPPAQGQGSLTLAASKRGKLRAFKAQGTPETTVSFPRGPPPCGMLPQTWWL